MENMETITAENNLSIRPGEIVIPEQHNGIIYLTFLSQLSKARDTRRYLEIGVRFGETFSAIHTDIAVGIDPEFAIHHNVAANKKRVTMLSLTSDAFFADSSCVQNLEGPPDLVFLDGMHLFEYLVRDFYNSEALSSEKTLIAMHDCLPLNAEMADRSMTEAFRRGENTPFPTAWTGDVWKIIPILQKYRPDLKIVCVDCPPTGLLFVTNLDPENTILKDRYLDVVEEFYKIPNTVEEIRKMYSSITIIPSVDVLNNFGHSLFFKV